MSARHDLARLQGFFDDDAARARVLAMRPRRIEPLYGPSLIERVNAVLGRTFCALAWFSLGAVTSGVVAGLLAT